MFFSDSTIAGTVFTDKYVSAKQGELVELKISLPTGNYAPGRYKAVALAFEKNEYGTQIGVDRVDPALCFEVINSNEDNLVWLHQYWGHVRFDDMIIEETVVK